MKATSQQTPEKGAGNTTVTSVKATTKTITTGGPKSGRRNGAANGAGSSSDPPHVCGICNKCFDRRDLRDRHKRRCARSATKVKVSKRKSCLACAQSKLGCDLDTPACSRCVSRGTNCEYAVPPPSALSSIGASGAKTASARTVSQSAIHATHRASSYAKHGRGVPYHANCPSHPVEMPSIPLTSSSASGYPTPPFQETLMPWYDNFQGHQSFDLFGSLTSQPFLPHVPSTPSSAHGTSVGFDGHDVDSFSPQEAPPRFSDWYQDNGISSGFQVHQNHIHGPWQIDPELRHPREADLVHYHHSSPMENHSFSLFNALNIPVHDASLSPTHSVGPLEANSTFFTTPTLPFEVSSTDSWRESSATRTNSTSDLAQDFGSGFFDLQSLARLAATTNLQAAQNMPFSDFDVIKLVQSYPTMLLQKSFYPPFVHHQLYRCAEGGVAGPLANALCCVSAYSSMIPSNESFVYNMINTEREHLVRGFHAWSSSDVNALGALHAMCVYQIIGLLDAQDSTQIRHAELQHPFFLKMARRLCHDNFYSEAGKYEAKEWQSWLVAETLRRIIFLVLIVNTISRRAHCQNPSYYDALDENLIFSLALPAPDPMWKACTAGEWESAKTKLGWHTSSPRTVHMVLDRLDEGHTDEDNRAWFEDFQPLSLLIIACVRQHL